MESTAEFFVAHLISASKNTSQNPRIRQDFEGGELILGGVDEEKMETNLTWVTWWFLGSGEKEQKGDLTWFCSTKKFPGSPTTHFYRLVS